MIFDLIAATQHAPSTKLKPMRGGEAHRAAIVPISILTTRTTNGQSMLVAEALSSQDPGPHGGSLGSSEFRLPSSQEGPRFWNKKDRIAERSGLKGTPMLIWRKSDGTAGRIDGIPKELGGL